MKKLSLALAILLVAMLGLGASALAETKMGQALYAAHGTRAFCVATVAMDGDTIAAALLDEFQFVSPEGFATVPNPETFTNADGNVLGSKRLNDEAYSANMANSGATQNLVTSYKAIEAYVVGMTVADLEAALEGKTSEDMVDAVSSSTLTDTYGYLMAILEAARDAAAE